MMMAFSVLFVLFGCCIMAASAQSSVTSVFYNLGTNCTSAANIRESWYATGSCLPMGYHPEDCMGKSQCGVIYNCDANSVTISYWFSAGQACLRGSPEKTRTFPTNKCLPPSTDYYGNNLDNIFSCKI